MPKSEYFDGVKKIEYDDLQNPEFCAWFFAECSRHAYRPKPVSYTHLTLPTILLV